MPRTCTVCNHPGREEIERGLLAGEPFRHIAARSGTSTGALQRHRAEHLPAVLVEAHDAAEIARSDNLLDQVFELQARAFGILAKAEAAGDWRSALLAIRESRELVELLASATPQQQAEPSQQSIIDFIRRSVVIPKSPLLPALPLPDGGSGRDGEAHGPEPDLPRPPGYRRS